MSIATRPVIPGFHPDPSICRAGDHYYLACSSFEYAPGVPVFRSSDLRSWELVGHALHRPSQLALDGVVPSGGIFAPTLRHHDGRFWMITTNFSDGPGQLLVTAEDPAGPWSDPIRVPDAIGIDPDLAWDEDGSCYLTWAGYHDDAFHVVQARLDTQTGQLLSAKVPLWAGTGGSTPEGPHLYQIGDHWYLLIAEGGTERGHSATISRGPTPQGPFESCPSNPILTARGTDSPVQNAGHADLVEQHDGTWAIVHLGVRARGASPQWHVLGRETFAAHVEWHDGWPRLGEAIEPPGEPIVREEWASGSAVPPTWVAPGGFPDDVLTAEDGAWKLTTDEAAPAFVGRRQEHLRARVQLDVDARAGSGGLELRIDDRHRLSVEVSADLVRATAHVGGLVIALGQTASTVRAVLELRVEAADGAGQDIRHGPDLLVVGVATAAGFVELGRLDGRYLSTEVAGGMTGRLVGATCSRGAVFIHGFTYTGSDLPEARLDTTS